MKEIEALNIEISEMEQQVKEVNVRNQSLRMKKEEVMQELEGMRAQVETSQREYRRLLKEQEVGREEQAEFIGNRYKVSLQCPTDKKKMVRAFAKHCILKISNL